MSTEVATSKVALSYRDKIDTIKKTVAVDATDAQLEMFLTLADKYQLDPFLREIWFNKQLGVITGRDGYLKIAQRDPDYDGIVSAAVCEGDTFEMDPVTPIVKHAFGAKRGAVIGAYAIVFHKRRRPVVCFAPYAEYAKAGAIWSTYKSAMCCKVAEVLALKRQFGISGLVTEEEVGSSLPLERSDGHATNRRDSTPPRVVESEVIDVEPDASHAKPWHTRKEMVAKFAAVKDLAESLNIGGVYAAVLKDYGVASPDKFSDPNIALDCYRALEKRLMDAEQTVGAA